MLDTVRRRRTRRLPLLLLVLAAVLTVTPTAGAAGVTGGSALMVLRPSVASTLARAGVLVLPAGGVGVVGGVAVVPGPGGTPRVRMSAVGLRLPAVYGTLETTRSGTEVVGLGGSLLFVGLGSGESAVLRQPTAALGANQVTAFLGDDDYFRFAAFTLDRSHETRVVTRPRAARRDQAAAHADRGGRPQQRPRDPRVLERGHVRHALDRRPGQLSPTASRHARAHSTS